MLIEQKSGLATWVRSTCLTVSWTLVQEVGWTKGRDETFLCQHSQQLIHFPVLWKCKGSLSVNFYPPSLTNRKILVKCVPHITLQSCPRVLFAQLKRASSSYVRETRYDNLLSRISDVSDEALSSFQQLTSGCLTGSCLKAVLQGLGLVYFFWSPRSVRYISSQLIVHIIKVLYGTLKQLKKPGTETKHV